MSIKWISLLSIVFLIIGFIGSIEANSSSTQFKAIVFDFGSVIAKVDKQEVACFIAQSWNISETEGLEALKKLKEATDQEKLEEDFWIAYANVKKVSLPENWMEQLNEARLHAVKQIPGMVSLVKNLQKQGYQTALLSNVRKGQAEIKQKLGYYDLFNPVLLSYEMGIKKPDPQAFTTLLKKLALPAEAILFIDNREQNIQAAKALGIDGIVFTNRDQLIKELKQRGIEISFSSNL